MNFSITGYSAAVDGPMSRENAESVTRVRRLFAECERRYVERRGRPRVLVIGADERRAAIVASLQARQDLGHAAQQSELMVACVRAFGHTVCTFDRGAAERLNLALMLHLCCDEVQARAKLRTWTWPLRCVLGSGSKVCEPAARLLRGGARLDLQAEFGAQLRRAHADAQCAARHADQSPADKETQ